MLIRSVVLTWLTNKQNKNTFLHYICIDNQNNVINVTPSNFISLACMRSLFLLLLHCIIFKYAYVKFSVSAIIIIFCSNKLTTVTLFRLPHSYRDLIAFLSNAPPSWFVELIQLQIFKEYRVSHDLYFFKHHYNLLVLIICYLKHWKVYSFTLLIVHDTYRRSETGLMSISYKEVIYRDRQYIAILHWMA